MTQQMFDEGRESNTDQEQRYLQESSLCELTDRNDTAPLFVSTLRFRLFIWLGT